jgi:hypothetical protein
VEEMSMDTHKPQYTDAELDVIAQEHMLQYSRHIARLSMRLLLRGQTHEYDHSIYNHTPSYNITYSNVPITYSSVEEYRRSITISYDDIGVTEALLTNTINIPVGTV